MNIVYSRHMTKNDLLFLNITKINSGKVIFGDNLKGKIIGVGNIKGKSSLLIENVFLIDSLKHNLLSINQLYDKGYVIVFNHARCLILENKVIFVDNKKENVYKIKIDACMGI